MKKIAPFFLSLVIASTLTAKHKQHHKQYRKQYHEPYYQQYQTPVPANEQQCWELAKKAFDSTNIFRQSQGLPTLLWNQELAYLAQEHSFDMGHYYVAFGHNGFKNRVSNFPAFARAAAENVFMGNSRNDIAEKAVNSWIHSPGHLKNLIGNYKYCGIGVYQNEEGYWYFTQLFASF